MTDPVGALGPEAWMQTPEVTAVLAALTEGGAPARFVGGCVRDAIAKRPIRDIDIATPLAPEAVLGRLEKAGIKAIPSGLDHGTVTAVIGGRSFEITTLRRDVATDGRHATVAFTDDWLADAARRDFTINALSATPDGQVYDPFHGLDDLKEGRIRFIGDPEQRIREDRLRLLRFFRFFAWYGIPPADPTALAACRHLAPELAKLSGERIRSELFKLLGAPEPTSTVLLMRGERVLAEILPEAGPPGRLRALAWLETTALRLPSLAPDPLRRLAALLETDADGARAVAARLKLSAAERDRLIALATPGVLIRAPEDPRNTRRLLHQLGTERFIDLVLLAWAARVALEARLPHPETDGFRALLDAAASWQPPVFPLKGQDLRDRGVPAGPELGRLLAQVEQWWIGRDFQPDREACLAKLEEILKDES